VVKQFEAADLAPANLAREALGGPERDVLHGLSGDFAGLFVPT
jgi:hypothetical protein